MVKKEVIFNFVGFLLILEGIFMFLGIPFSIYYQDNDIYVLLFTGLFTSLFGLVLFLISKNKDKDIRKREGYIVVSIGWIVTSLFGALPFVIHGSIPSYTDAFFETMSGFTTTGASILNDIEALPHGLLFWRSVTQWLGGMGMIVLSLAILPILGIGGMQLFVAEVPGPTKDKLHPRVRETAVRLWGIYVLLTFVEVLLLVIGGMTLFDAVCHSFTTMATGGFSTKQASIAYYQSPFIHYVIIFFMFAAGVNFTLHYHLLHGRFENLKKNEEFKFYLTVILFWTFFIAVILYLTNYGSAEQSFRDSLFQVVSIITTTGFVTADYEIWGTLLLLIFFLFLFSGSCAGSTGGGIKIVRHLLLFKNSFLELRRLIHPRAVIPVRYNGHSVPQDIISNILAFFLFYIFIFIMGSLVMAALGLDFMTAIGSVATSLGNVGPAIGSVGPTDNFANIPTLGKWFLSFFMLLGRLELFTILVIFSPAFWKS
ncbi:MAG: TrkH family potassium uptake protein [Ignavibacteriales bacterium]|nr:TrkH family potassium uptake protein [Ignavibacteriales bacterium]